MTMGPSHHHCPMGTHTACAFACDPVVTLDVDSGPFPTCSVYRCQTCGHGVADPAIQDVAELYETRDSQDYQTQDTGLAEYIKRLVFLRDARAVIRILPAPPASVIDFACGSGLLTTCLASALPKTSHMTALDFFNTPPRDMGSVIYRSFAEMESLNQSADLVTCFHALEHDNDPDDFIRRLISLLRPGGILLIEVPNMDAVWGAIFGRHWDNWYLPYHRTHFSEQSLSTLLTRHGLDIIERRPICLPSMGRSLAKLTRSRNSLPFLLAGAVLHPLQWIVEGITMRPSALRVVARLPA